jgi:hypothetical protein
MRMLSHVALRTPQMLALLLLALTLARPVSSQTTAPDDTIQVIAQQQKAISQTYKLERIGEEVMYRETLALLAAYGGWTTTAPPKEENLHLLEAADQSEKQDLVYAKKAVQRNKSVSEDELKRFSDIYVNVETLLAVAIDVYDLLKNGKIDEANALYRDKSTPLIRAINFDSYTLISSLEKKVDKAALHARLAK